MTGVTQLGLAAELAARMEKSGPITIGLAGAGQMGTDIVVEVALMTGVRIGAISEVRTEAARDAALLSGFAADDIVNASSPSDIDRAIEANKIAITDDLNALCAAGRIDVVIDATGNPNIGTLFALEAMKNGKHVVMLNVEADITVGRFLKEEARKAGVVYTGAAGDEPACTMEIISFAQSLGFEIVAAGKGKNNPLKFDAMPADYEQEARERNMNARMLVEFVDGTKTMVEMVAVANATGLVPDVPGMHGPKATREELAQVLCTKEDGGILSRSGVVDYSIGKGVAPGVFCIVKPKHPRVLERMIDLKVGPGPCFSILRPYHLTSLETPLSAARAVAFGKPDMQPLDHPVAECVSVAKRDLQPGETLGKIGETDYRGFAMTWSEARSEKALPLGLSERAKVIKPIKAGERLTYDNCQPDESFIVTQIRRRLDEADQRFVSAA
ncbi:NAD(P)H-dependent oxidoreductase [Microvirga guangxiensis]|uniref:Predicted homoserine dehydrogenase, contains C-terminal SAF domain n=1 Tax=Microvirga guangxiensis TaxID=549386 RepID=A0A1G5E4U9_9HYPH|nr:homoserine dehydrogenase [Microvirga guangxiensis]SCY21750.1 Predicted homoserine dehydrogenase, contains C-terminal SAF domain [Microvirga guangxiensis]